MDERRGSVARVQCGRGGLLHDERAIASFLEGDATIIRLNSTEAAVWFLFLRVHERRRGVQAIAIRAERCGGGVVPVRLLFGPSRTEDIASEDGGIRGECQRETVVEMEQRGQIIWRRGGLVYFF